MSLRRKTLLAIVLVSIGLTILLLLVSQLIILNQFDQLQSDAIRQNVQRVENALNKEMSGLSSTSSDWAYWDDTYQFVQDANTDYIESNLTIDTFKNLRVNFIVYVDNAGHTVYGKAYNFEQQTVEDLPVDLNPQQGQLHPLLAIGEREGVREGLITSSEGPIMVASRFIIPSSKVGDSQGVLILGRYLDESEINLLAQQTELMLDLKAISDVVDNSDFAIAQSTLMATNAPVVGYDRSRGAALGYTLLDDLDGHAAYILRVETPATIYQAGERTGVYFLAVMLVAELVLGAVFVGWLERRLLNRLTFMDQRMAEIGNSDDLSARIPVSGDNDELTRLAATINDSLAKREHSQEQKLRELNNALQETNAQLNEKMLALRQNQSYRDRFFSHASHEFRTPLAIMGTRLYLARRKPEEWETHIQVLQETQRRLLNIIDDVFDMTKLQENDLTLNMHKTELTNYLPMVLNDMEIRLADRGAKLITEFPADEIYVKLDAIYFGKAFEKLMNFMLENGEINSDVIIRVQKQMMESQAIANITICGRKLHFKPQEVTELFSPFYQVSEGKTYTSGLDLALAKQIITVHEGTLVAIDNETTGGCFRITMPIITKSSPEPVVPVAVS